MRGLERVCVRTCMSLNYTIALDDLASKLVRVAVEAKMKFGVIQYPCISRLNASCFQILNLISDSPFQIRVAVPPVQT